MASGNFPAAKTCAPMSKFPCAIDIAFDEEPYGVTSFSCWPKHHVWISIGTWANALRIVACILETGAGLLFVNKLLLLRHWGSHVKEADSRNLCIATQQVGHIDSIMTTIKKAVYLCLRAPLGVSSNLVVHVLYDTSSINLCPEAYFRATVWESQNIHSWCRYNQHFQK